MRIGNRLGDYVLVDELGEGGFGEVWRAEDRERPGGFVAVKVSTRSDAAAHGGPSHCAEFLGQRRSVSDRNPLPPANIGVAR